MSARRFGTLWTMFMYQDTRYPLSERVSALYCVELGAGDREDDLLVLHVVQELMVKMCEMQRPT